MNLLLSRLSNLWTAFRFISPAVVTPEIIDIEVPKGENSPTLRRGLMVIAKIIQNLANNIFFGKEAHMIALNEFLGNNIANVTRFLSELHVRIPLFLPLKVGLTSKRNIRLQMTILATIG